MFALVVRFELREGHEQAFDQLVAETLHGIDANEPDTLVYVSHRRDGAGNERVFYELYRDDEAFAAHEEQPHTKRFLAERDRHLRVAPEVWRLASVSGVSRGGVEIGSGRTL